MTANYQDSLTDYPASSYEISEDLIRKGWEQEEQVRKQREEVIQKEREERDKLFPQHTRTHPTETEDGQPFYKTHQEQELWMAADEKYGGATYNRPAKNLTTLEVRNLRSELKDVEGDMKGIVSEFKQCEARRKQIRQLLGLPLEDGKLD